VRPSFTPRALARARPSQVRARTSRCLPMRRKRTEAGALGGDRREGVQARPRELSEHAAELGAIGLRAARHLAEHLTRAGSLELAHLGVMLWPSVDTRAWAYFMGG
jgi:hypothetical protein